MPVDPAPVPPVTAVALPHRRKLAFAAGALLMVLALMTLRLLAGVA
jgi:hypothetical protein